MPPAPDPAAPLARLSAWHRLGEMHFETLRELLQRSAVAPVDAHTRAAAAEVRQYFDASATVHHEDEEFDLYPALVEAMAGSDAVCLRQMTLGVTALHRRIEAQWRRLRPSVAAIAAGQVTVLQAADVQALVDACCQAFRQEDLELLPMAHRLLGDDALAEIAAAMDTRQRAFDSRA